LNIPGAPVPQQGVSGIAVDPFDTTIVIVVYPATTNQVFMTSDSGAKWKDISATLPNLPVRSVVIDPNTSPHSIIIGTDAGVLRTRNWGVSWEILGTGLPTVQCTSLAIDFGLVPSLLRVGTYGRSVFELDYERVYVDWHNVVMQDGTVEHPFRTIQQALDAATHGGSKFINIEAGSYAEAPIYFRTCAFLNAVHGQVFVH
jgi:hypothetical protein